MAVNGNLTVKPRAKEARDAGGAPDGAARRCADATLARGDWRHRRHSGGWTCYNRQVFGQRRILSKAHPIDIAKKESPTTDKLPKYARLETTVTVPLAAIKNLQFPSPSAARKASQEYVSKILAGPRLRS